MNILDRNCLRLEYNQRSDLFISININDNNINQIDDESFQGLINLLDLNLSNNKIREIIY